MTSTRRNALALAVLMILLAPPSEPHTSISELCTPPQLC
jgi:hypothetical protein